MADQTNTSLHAHVTAHLSGQEIPVDIIAGSAAELAQIVAELTGSAAPAQAAPVAHPTAQDHATAAHQAAPAPQAAEGNAPQATAPSAATPTAQPQASAAATAPQAAVTPSAESTATAPNGPTLNDVLAVARELLQCSNGEETLRQILTANGAEAVSTAPAEAYPSIIAAINQSLGK